MPFITILPVVGRSKPAISRNVVVLPHPDGPNRVRNSPSLTCKSISSKTLFAPKNFVTFFSSNRGALGRDIGKIPEGLYPGDYLIPVGRALAERDGGKWLDKPESEWLKEFRTFAIDKMMDLIRDDLAALGIKFDVFSSERALVEAGKVDEVIEFLRGKGLIYEGVLEPPKGKIVEDYEPHPQTAEKPY